jgi:NCAIR mutase (PurE)-related protein
MRRIAAVVLLCVFGTLLPLATMTALAAPQQLLPICCRAHGAHSCVMGDMASAPSDAVPTLRQPACPFGQSLRAITTVAISADFTSRSSFGLAVANIDRQLIADAVATRVLRRSAPRGPPFSFSV